MLANKPICKLLNELRIIQPYRQSRHLLRPVTLNHQLHTSQLHSENDGRKNFAIGKKANTISTCRATKFSGWGDGGSILPVITHTDKMCMLKVYTMIF